MKKHIFLILSAALLGFTACSEDTLDTINKDNQHPTPNAVPAYLQLSEAIMSTGFSTVSGDYAFYLSSLNEQEIGVGNNQLMKAELRNAGEWASSTTFNNVWNSTYGNLMNIRQIQNKIENEVPGNIGMFDLLGIAQVLEALNFGILADMHGDIPYSEALQGQAIPQPKLDTQKEVYDGILATLDKAISNLEKGKSTWAKEQDLVLGGDPVKWEAFAYALKARYILHKSAVESNVWTQVESAAEKAVELGFDGVTITEFNGVTCDNPWSAYIWSRYYTASSKTVADLMEACGDPRLDYYTYYGDAVACAPGDEEASKVADGSLGYPAWYDFGSQPLHLFSKSELYFILAEARLRQGKDATAAYQTAVEASVSELSALFDDGVDAAAFAASLGTPTLQTLFEQKYVSQSYDEQVEAYNDIRRCKAMGESYINLTNPYNVQSGINRYPERLPYANSAVLGNPNVKAAYGDGTYIYTEKTWVNGGK